MSRTLGLAGAECDRKLGWPFRPCRQYPGTVLRAGRSPLFPKGLPRTLLPLGRALSCCQEPRTQHSRWREDGGPGSSSGTSPSLAGARISHVSGGDSAPSAGLGERRCCLGRNLLTSWIAHAVATQSRQAGLGSWGPIAGCLGWGVCHNSEPPFPSPVTSRSTLLGLEYLGL